MLLPATSSTPFTHQRSERLRAFLTPHWNALLARPFPRLVHHFALRLLQGTDSGESGLEIGASALLAILALPGAFFSIFLFDKYSSLLHFLRRIPNFDPIAASLPDKYFLIAFSMSVTGIVTVLRWDRILPDRQDYQNLAQLPIRARNVFFANLLASILVAALFTIDVNAASTILFPVVVTAGQGSPLFFLRTMGAHAVSAFAASIFSFAACFAVLGVLLVSLPPRWFRAASLWARGLLVTAQLAVLVFGLNGAQVMRMARRDPESWTNWLPPVWFTALYQSLQSPAANPELSRFATLAWQATCVAVVAALGIYVLGYRRSYLRVAEADGAASRGPGDTAGAYATWARWLDPVFGRTGPARAAGMFALRTLLRGETQSLLVGASLGMGVVLASIAALAATADQSPSLRALLSIPLILSYFLITSLRIAFEIPAELGANWAFQVAAAPGEPDARSVGRRLLWIASVCIGLLTFAGFALVWDIGLGALHCAFVAVANAVLIELLLFDWRKLPFTCSIPQPRNHAVLYLFAYLMGLAFFAGALSQIAALLLAVPLRFVAVPVLMAPAAFWWRSRLRQQAIFDRPLLYEEQPIRAVQTLNIFDRTM